MGEIKNLFLALFFFSFVVIGTSHLIGELNLNYGVTSVDVSYINKTNEMVNITKEMKDRLDVTTITSTNVINLLLSVIPGAWLAAKYVFKMLDVTTSLFADVATAIGIPAWIPMHASAAVSVLVVFGLIGVLLKWDL